MHSARLSVTTCVNRESYFYPKPVRRCSPRARLPCFSLPPAHDTRIILHAVMSSRRKRSQLSNTHHHFDPLIAESHFGVFIPTDPPTPSPATPLALINVQLFQTRRSSPVLRPPFLSFFASALVLSSSSSLSFFPTFPPSPNSYTSLPLLLWLSHSLLHKLLVSTFQNSLWPYGVKQQCPLKGDRIWGENGKRHSGSRSTTQTSEETYFFYLPCI